MLEPTEANPLGLPLGPEDLPHQLRLTRPNGLDATARTHLCPPVMEHLAPSQGTFYFNALIQPHQVVAILIIEEDNTSRPQMDVFIRARPEPRHAALHNSIHRNYNAELVFQEMR